MYKALIFSIIIYLSSCYSNPIDVPTKDNRLKILWSFEHGTAGDAPPEIFEDKLIMSAGLYVYALNKNTGDEIWKTKFEEDNILEGAILLINRDQVVAAHIDKIRAWNIYDGSQIWEFDYKSNDLKVRLTGKHVTTGETFGFTSERSRFFILDTSGNIDFVKLLDNNYGVQGLAYYRNKLFVGQARTIHGGLTLGRVTAFDAYSGDSLWAYNTEHNGFIYAAPVVENGIVYAGTAGNSPKNIFVALDAETGDVIWEKLLTDPLMWTRSFTVGPKHIFAAGSGKIFAINKETGDLVWDYRWESSSMVKPVYLGGYVYQSNHGNIFVLDAETGDLVHEEPGPEGGSYVWHLAVSDDKLFVQSSYKLVAYQPWHLRED